MPVHFTRSFSFRLTAVIGLVAFVLGLSLEARSDARAGKIDVGSGYAPSGGGIPVEAYSQSTGEEVRTVDQTQGGTACAQGGISDYNGSSCAGPKEPERDLEDNDTCRRFPGDPACRQAAEEAIPNCGPYASLRGGAGSTKFLCVCNSGGTPPNCRPSQEEESADSRYEGCKQQALQAVSRCEGGHSAAQNSCATTRVDGVVQQAQAANEQQLRQSENNAQACGGTAQAYQNAASQLGQVQSSCQSSVSQCASSCAAARNAVQQCPHSAVRARAQSIGPAQQSCTSGTLAQRPQEIAQTSGSLRDVGAKEARNCNQSTMASSAPNPSGGGLGGGGVNTSSGNLKQDPGDLTPGTGPGLGGNVGGDLTALPGTNSKMGNSWDTDSGSGSVGVDEVYNVSGKGAVTASSGGNSIAAGNSALASLPGTPMHTENNEDTEVVSSGKASGTGSGASGISAGGRRGGRMILPPKLAVTKKEETEAVKAAGDKAEETPDLSAFLPGQRRIAGGAYPGMNGCRIPNPQKPAECAVPHGPSANIWSKMKERFEEFRFMRPSQFFMNEE